MDIPDSFVSANPGNGYASVTCRYDNVTKAIVEKKLTVLKYFFLLVHGIVVTSHYGGSRDVPPQSIENFQFAESDLRMSSSQIDSVDNTRLPEPFSVWIPDSSKFNVSKSTL